MRIIPCLLVLSLVLLAGCESPEKRAAKERAREEAAAKADSEFQAKLESIKHKKIVNIRVNKESVDFVTEDGVIFSVYSEAYRYRNNVYSRIHIK
jgi:hypothetical protein